MSITEQLLGPLRTSAPARPLITHYDEDAGSRVELSVATIANWAAKTANWLVEEFDVEPSDEVAVLLPSHWQTVGVVLGAWWCGANVVADPNSARVAFVGPDTPTQGAEATAVVALDPLGGALVNPPPGAAHDYLAESRLAGDEFSPLFPISGDSPALLGASVDEVVSVARTRAQDHGISSGDRVLSTMDWTLPDGVLNGLLAPLSAGAHLVQVTGSARETTLADRRNAERTSVELHG